LFTALNEYCVELRWDDPPLFVLLFWLNIDGIYYLPFLGVINSYEFHIVVDVDQVERKEGVSCTCVQGMHPKPRIIDISNEVGQGIAPKGV